MRMWEKRLRLASNGIALCLALGLGTATSVHAQDAALGGETFQCIIEPHAVVNLGSPVEGVLESVEVGRGDRVVEGRIVARLESSVEEALVEIARARAETDMQVRAGRAKLDFQNSQLERNEQLLKRNVLAMSAIEESRTEKMIAELALREAEVNRNLAALELRQANAVLARRTIKSPMSGIVVDRFLSPGEYVSEQAPLIRLARMDILHVEMFMKIAHYGAVKLGMRAEVMPQEPIGGRYTATVTAVDSLLDAASGTFRVRLTLPNEDLALPAGIRCGLRFAEG